LVLVICRLENYVNFFQVNTRKSQSRILGRHYVQDATTLRDTNSSWQNWVSRHIPTGVGAKNSTVNLGQNAIRDNVISRVILIITPDLQGSQGLRCSDAGKLCQIDLIRWGNTCQVFSSSSSSNKPSISGGTKNRGYCSCDYVSPASRGESFRRWLCRTTTVSVNTTIHVNLSQLARNTVKPRSCIIRGVIIQHHTAQRDTDNVDISIAKATCITSNSACGQYRSRGNSERESCVTVNQDFLLVHMKSTK